MNALKRVASGTNAEDPVQQFVQRIFPMGKEQFCVDKALAAADALEDEEIVQKLQLQPTTRALHISQGSVA